MNDHAKKKKEEKGRKKVKDKNNLTACMIELYSRTFI
jgi:hypothetical protein